MMNKANPDLITRLPNVPRIGNNFEAGVARIICASFFRSTTNWRPEAFRRYRAFRSFHGNGSH
ncbi:MAG: Cof protein, HD superfamily hydrolase [uncultured Paraburkholderia sp.]|nr:MAG: Cof protein, HD superfamily hydrolase [uncultured Paraburkholderia sp.]CAH2917988.1 MAG: Cof protein, HD superfamily hydrolase [uncultured Paraburkholderia sp.]